MRSRGNETSKKISIIKSILVFVGLRGPDPGSEINVCQQTPILLALSVVTYLCRSKSHPKQYGRVLEPDFCIERERERNSSHLAIIRSMQVEIVCRNFEDQS